MKNSALFYGAIGVAIVAILLGVYYFTPGIYHPFVLLSRPTQFINNPTVNNAAHHRYSAVFFGLAVVFLIAAFLTRPKKSFAK